jgi:carboxylate-amine ligase
VRPSAHAPTLELRVCDACPLIDDAVLIAGLFRALVRSAELEVEAGKPKSLRPLPLHRAAFWQAARGGLSGRLLDHTDHPRPVPAVDAVHDLLAHLRPVLEELGDWAEVCDLTETALARGNSADRQRAAFAERGDLTDVMQLVVDETQGPPSGPVPARPVLRRYRARAGDEGVAASALPRPAYRPVVEFFEGLGPDGVHERESERDRWVAEHRLDFGVAGAKLPFRVDLVPRIVQRHEWAGLEAGLVQRARAIEAFLHDVYGERRILRDRVLPESAVLDTPGWRQEAERLPPGTLRAPIQGFDLVRNEYGGWRVLEDNLRNPSGVGYAIAVRQLTDAVLPDLPRPEHLADPATALERLRSTVLAGAKPGTRGALLSSGPVSSAWFEHQRLADGAGLLLMEADDLDVRGGQVVHRGTGTAIGALYLRLDVELTDLLDSTGRPVGADAFEVAAAGGVSLVNAPGNGVADDKAMYRSVPELIGYYLEERPLLESVPTYRTRDRNERYAVLERVGELVTKPVDGSGGRGVLIGPVADAAEVAARRAEIAEHPGAWVAQEVVPLSSVPALEDGFLQPRHVDLRAFVYATGRRRRDYALADVALTRVAPEGSLVVNSSRGGGAKDTWIVHEPRGHHGHHEEDHVRPRR